MPAVAIEREVTDYINERAETRDESGLSFVVCNEVLPERQVTIGLEPIAVSQLRMRDRWPPLERQSFRSNIRRKSLRQTKSIEQIIPWPDLKGTGTSDFPKVLQSLLETEATGLSPSNNHSTEVWKDETAEWSKWLT